jgi:hypothetical protein
MKTRAAGDVASGWIRLGGSVRGGCRWGLRGWAGLFLAGLLGAGCASPSTVTTRKQERAAAYAALSAEHQALVDAGRVAVGMGEDAVYMAWGKPAQVLQSGDATGLRTTWLYHGNTTDTYQYWHYSVQRRALEWRRLGGAGGVGAHDGLSARGASESGPAGADGWGARGGWW